MFLQKMCFENILFLDLYDVSGWRISHLRNQSKKKKVYQYHYHLLLIAKSIFENEKFRC